MKKFDRFGKLEVSLSIKTMNMGTKYTPKPIDTEGVELPAELSVLAEEIAKNLHEVWSQNRMNEGWTYGKQRDDEKKTHPCPIAYGQLSENEKEYDRASS